MDSQVVCNLLEYRCASNGFVYFLAYLFYDFFKFRLVSWHTGKLAF